MSRALEGALWIGFYVLLVLAPVFLLLSDPLPLPGDFWGELAVALGFASLGMMGMQFLLTARFRRVAAPFGTDILYYFHRYLGYLILGVLGVHAAAFVVSDPGILDGLSPWSLSRPLSLGTAAFVAAAVLVASSVVRSALGLPYEGWRLLHAVLAVVAVAGGLLHALDYGAHTRTGWDRAFWLLYGMAGVALLAYVRVLKPWRARRRPWTVVVRREEAGDVATLTLEPRGHDGISFRAGQFAWLTLDQSPFAMAEHPFSFSSAPGTCPRIEFTIQPIGDFTRRAVDAEPGTEAFLEGPHGIFTLEDHPAPGYVFVAGGIGIAPLMSILRDRADRDDERPFLLLYGTRSEDRAVFVDELERLEGILDLRVVHLVEEPSPGWEGEVGRIDAELLDRHLPRDRRERRYLMCGPEAMQAAVERLLEEAGVPTSRIHTEIFHWV
ncbi:MAG TPA: ferric reductase-like transmembrane domain-containing protein [Longimicrobiales bacterium]|nr:ferric reductase-like transmembrane domain-containing protein [Longimicrobiales bacterium]